MAPSCYLQSVASPRWQAPLRFDEERFDAVASAALEVAALGSGRRSRSARQPPSPGQTGALRLCDGPAEAPRSGRARSEGCGVTEAPSVAPGTPCQDRSGVGAAMRGPAAEVDGLSDDEGEAADTHTDKVADGNSCAARVEAVTPKAIESCSPSRGRFRGAPCSVTPISGTPCSGAPSGSTAASAADCTCRHDARGDFEPLRNELRRLETQFGELDKAFSTFRQASPGEQEQQGSDIARILDSLQEQVGSLDAATLDIAREVVTLEGMAYDMLASQQDFEQRLTLLEGRSGPSRRTNVTSPRRATYSQVGAEMGCAGEEVATPRDLHSVRANLMQIRQSLLTEDVDTPDASAGPHAATDAGGFGDADKENCGGGGCSAGGVVKAAVQRMSIATPRGAEAMPFCRHPLTLASHASRLEPSSQAHFRPRLATAPPSAMKRGNSTGALRSMAGSSWLQKLESQPHDNCASAADMRALQDELSKRLDASAQELKALVDTTLKDAIAHTEQESATMLEEFKSEVHQAINTMQSKVVGVEEALADAADAQFAWRAQVDGLQKAVAEQGTGQSRVEALAATLRESICEQRQELTEEVREALVSLREEVQRSATLSVCDSECHDQDGDDPRMDLISKELEGLKLAVQTAADRREADEQAARHAEFEVMNAALHTSLAEHRQELQQTLDGMQSQLDGVVEMREALVEEQTSCRVRVDAVASGLQKTLGEHREALAGEVREALDAMREELRADAADAAEPCPEQECHDEGAEEGRLNLLSLELKALKLAVQGSADHEEAYEALRREFRQELREVREALEQAPGVMESGSRLRDVDVAVQELVHDHERDAIAMRQLQVRLAELECDARETRPSSVERDSGRTTPAARRWITYCDNQQHERPSRMRSLFCLRPPVTAS